MRKGLFYLYLLFFSAGVMSVFLVPVVGFLFPPIGNMLNQIEIGLLSSLKSIFPLSLFWQAFFAFYLTFSAATFPIFLLLCALPVARSHFRDNILSILLSFFSYNFGLIPFYIFLYYFIQMASSHSVFP